MFIIEQRSVLPCHLEFECKTNQNLLVRTLAYIGRAKIYVKCLTGKKYIYCIQNEQLFENQYCRSQYFRGTKISRIGAHVHIRDTKFSRMRWHLYEKKKHE